MSLLADPIRNALLAAFEAVCPIARVHIASSFPEHRAVMFINEREESLVLVTDVTTAERVAKRFKVVPPPKFGLTPTQDAIFALLKARGGAVTREAIMNSLYSHRPDEPFEQVITVNISKMRKKLKPFGFSITAEYGRGYRLTENVDA